MVILCDEKLQELLKCESISALGIPEMLTRYHLCKKAWYVIPLTGQYHLDSDALFNDVYRCSSWFLYWSRCRASLHPHFLSVFYLLLLLLNYWFLLCFYWNQSIHIIALWEKIQLLVMGVVLKFCYMDLYYPSLVKYLVSAGPNQPIKRSQKLYIQVISLSLTM